jgi:hypothetical protein
VRRLYKSFGVKGLRPKLVADSSITTKYYIVVSNGVHIYIYTYYIYDYLQHNGNALLKYKEQSHLLFHSNPVLLQSNNHIYPVSYKCMVLNAL